MLWASYIAIDLLSCIILYIVYGLTLLEVGIKIGKSTTYILIFNRVLFCLDSKADTTEIQISDQQYVERGDSINLECNATGQYYTPDDIDWFRNGERVTSDANYGIRLLKQLSIAEKTFTSRLEIERARMSDSGVYVCRSSNMQVASTKVHVLNGKEKGT